MWAHNDTCEGQVGIATSQNGHMCPDKKMQWNTRSGEGLRHYSHHIYLDFEKKSECTERTLSSSESTWRLHREILNVAGQPEDWSHNFFFSWSAIHSSKTTLLYSNISCGLIMVNISADLCLAYNRAKRWATVPFYTVTWLSVKKLTDFLSDILCMHQARYSNNVAKAIKTQESAMWNWS